eukprot:g10401.t1
MTGPPVGEVEYENKPMSDTTGTRQGGVRVLVGNSPRYRAHTSEEYPSGSGRWPGVGMGLICTEPPPTGEECETIRCENPANCLDRFESAGYYYDDIGTAEVDCNGKQGRYVTIELPGLTASDSDKIRSAGLTEVRVFAPAEETTSVVPFGPAQEPATTSPPPASAEDTTSIAPLGPAAKTSATSSPPASAARTGPAEDETSIAPLVIGGVVVLAVVVDVVEMKKPTTTAKSMKRPAADNAAGEGAGKAAAKKTKVEVSAAAGADHQAGDQEEQQPEEKQPRLKKQKTGFLYELNVKYNELQNSTKPRNTEKLVTSIIQMIEDPEANKMSPLQLGNSPDGSRCLQACLKHGTKTQRGKILDFFNQAIPDLIVAGNAGGVLVEKILRYCPKVEGTGVEDEVEEEKTQSHNKYARPDKVSATQKKEQEKIVEKILKPLLNLPEQKFTKIFFHKFGCKCFSNLWNCAYLPAKMKNELMNRVLVPKQLALLLPQQVYQNGNKKLSVLLFQEKNPHVLEKKAAIIAHLSESVDKCTDKELWDVEISHGIIQLFLQLLAEEEDTSKMKAFVESESRFPIEAAPHLLQTKAGCEALIRLLGYYSAKQKKTLVKNLKGKFRDLAQNGCCYLFVLRLLQVLDDTVLTKKQVLSEICEPAETTFSALLTEDPKGSLYVRKILYACLEAPTSRRFSPYELDSCVNLVAPSALKDKEKRREELGKYVAPILKKAIFGGEAATSTSKERIGLAKALQTKVLADMALHFLVSDGEGSSSEKLIGQSLNDDELEELLLGEKAHTSAPTILALLKNSKAFAERVTAFAEKDENEGLLQKMVLTRAAYFVVEAYKVTLSATLKDKCLGLKKAIDSAEQIGVNVKGAKVLLDVLDEN